MKLFAEFVPAMCIEEPVVTGYICCFVCFANEVLYIIERMESIYVKQGFGGVVPERAYSRSDDFGSE